MMKLFLEYIPTTLPLGMKDICHFYDATFYLRYIVNVVSVLLVDNTIESTIFIYSLIGEWLDYILP